MGAGRFTSCGSSDVTESIGTEFGGESILAAGCAKVHGAIEAGIGSVKSRTEQHSSARARARAWTCKAGPERMTVALPANEFAVRCGRGAAVEEWAMVVHP